ncbi:hypothetical protein [Azonexus sp.]|uniref:hypothetical protein n=1 Tax=Azonexus sp. TaxID=1872668 RepID=UPI0035AF072D
MQHTHKGWFLLCPIYLADVESDGPQIEPRRYVPAWWLNANIALCDALLMIVELFGGEPMYPMLITGEIKRGTST